MKKIILNLGCGKTRIPNSLGVDIRKIGDYVDIIHNLDVLPYPFKSRSVSEIHLYHVLEHIHEPLKKMEELYRILKLGGIVYLRVPHFSSMGAFSDITHIRPFGYTSFGVLEKSDYHYYYSRAKFKIIHNEIKYFGLYPNKEIYAKYIHKNSCLWFARPIIRLINFLIKLSPLSFERFWCYWVGGATEIVVTLEKV